LRDLACPSAEIHYAPAKAGEQMRSCIDVSKAKKAFGWAPTMDFAKGLAHTLDWYRSAER
jgi:dTDP-D-glucose 4,6-dehydratase